MKTLICTQILLFFFTYVFCLSFFYFLFRFLFPFFVFSTHACADDDDLDMRELEMEDGVSQHELQAEIARLRSRNRSLTQDNLGLKEAAEAAETQISSIAKEYRKMLRDKDDELRVRDFV